MIYFQHPILPCYIRCVCCDYSEGIGDEQECRIIQGPIVRELLWTIK